MVLKRLPLVTSGDTDATVTSLFFKQDQISDANLDVGIVKLSFGGQGLQSLFRSKQWLLSFASALRLVLDYTVSVLG